MEYVVCEATGDGGSAADRCSPLALLETGPFEFARAEVRQLRRKRGLFSSGMVIEHAKSDYPPFILFWTFRYNKLAETLRRLGYDVEDAA